MPTTLFSDKDAVELKAKLRSIIDVENEDNWKTHLRQTILSKDNWKVSGSVKQDRFAIWSHEHGMIMTGIFYPIVQGQFRPLSQGLEIVFKSKMNIVGRALFAAIAIMTAYGMWTGIVIQETNELRFLIPRLLIATILFGLMISVPSFIYVRTSRTVTKALIEQLGLRNAR
jgi:hypothetical protein